MAPNEAKGPFHPLHFFLYLLGGAGTGFGLLSLYWSWGMADGKPLNGDFAEVGFSALDKFSQLGAADYALPCVILGVCCLAMANLEAWRQTGGY